MTFLRGVILSCVSVGMVFAVTPTTAATERACVCGKPTAASYTWNFKGETDGIFKAMQEDALAARNSAARIESFIMDSNVSWDSHVEQLDQLSDAVNDLGNRLCRLETIRRVDSPWQQAEIDRIATTVQLMADNAEDAITFGNGHRRDLWLSPYRKYTDNLYHEARSLMQSVKVSVEYANTSKEYRTLRQEMKVPAS